jgi:hypothetical protein
MSGLHTFMQLDTKRKALVILAVTAWFLSIRFSKNGFSLDAPNMAWMGWLLGLIVTGVELAFNDRNQKQTLTIIIIGLICYSYGVWTNVTGFWDAQNPGQAFQPFDPASLMAWFVGLILEILPEPLFMTALGRGREADPLGNIAEIGSGKLNMEGLGSDRSASGNDRRNNNNNNNNRYSSTKPEPRRDERPVNQNQARNDRPKPPYRPANAKSMIGKDSGKPISEILEKFYGPDHGMNGDEGE